jgi:hypothetical protein
MKFLMPLFALLIIIVAGLLAYAYLRTYRAEHSANQERFVKGTAPLVAPVGLYRGTVTGYTGAWRGKAFKDETSGINIFEDAGQRNERYPFKTYVAPGIRDTDVSVLKIDYNIPGNPWWLKFILDEVVEVAPNTLLGKVHVHFGSVAFTLGYFTLEKSE